MTFILIHSPLVGPLTWALVGEELRQRGQEAIVPRLADSPEAHRPYWQQHAEAVARTVAGVPSEQSLTLVAHSGAGPLLPAIRQALSQPVAAYVFVDAGVPEASVSRLDARTAESPERAEPLRELLARDERFPNWREEDLREIVPDARLRQQLLAELNPRGHDFFEEPIPVFDGFPDAPCAYLQFSPPYAQAAAYARAHGWPCCKLEAGHFHMLVDHVTVTDTMLDLSTRVQ